MEKLSVRVQGYITDFNINEVPTITIKYVVRISPKRMTPEAFADIINYIIDNPLDIETDSLQSQQYGIIYPEDKSETD